MLKIAEIGYCSDTVRYIFKKLALPFLVQNELKFFYLYSITVKDSPVFIRQTFSDFELIVVS